MGVHDWSRVTDREFHDFHNVWTANIRSKLNSSLLPHGYFARCEQKYGTPIADVLTLFSPESPPPEVNGYHPTESGVGGVALAVAPPRLKSVLLEPPVGYRNRTVVIRQEADERPVAVLEVVSRSNKDTVKRLAEFVSKVRMTLDAEIHVVLLDLLPTPAVSPGGLHVAISSDFGLSVTADRADWQPAERPIATISYLADRLGMSAYYDYLKAGEPLPELPLFLSAERYINLPLDETYRETFRGTAGITRQKLDG